MSTGKRAYDLLRAYVNQEWDRIQGLERSSAVEELDAALDSTNVANYKVVEKQVHLSPEESDTYARQVLGVPNDADFETIRHAFERLCKRSDPGRFPEGSSEARQAEDIRKRVYWAYNLLTANVDETEMRFRSLEIE